LPAVKHAEYKTLIAIGAIINGVRKAPCEHAVKPEDFRMHAAVKLERANVRKQGIEKIVAESVAMTSIKAAAAIKILDRGRKDADLHEA
jgi:hypothetical protein